MNKKFLSVVLFGALMAGSSVTFTGCIDNDEPAGIENLRGAKAELLKAKAAVETAKVAYVNAQTAQANAEARRLEAVALQAELKAKEMELEKGIIMLLGENLRGCQRTANFVCGHEIHACYLTVPII